MSDQNGTHKNKLRNLVIGKDAGHKKIVTILGEKWLVRQPSVDLRTRWLDVLVQFSEALPEGVDLDELKTTEVMKIAKNIPEIMEVQVDLVIGCTYSGEAPHDAVFSEDDKTDMMSSHNPDLIEELGGAVLEVMNEAIDKGKKPSAATQNDGPSTGLLPSSK